MQVQDKTVSFKLSETLLEKLEKRAAAEGKSKSRVIKDALSLYLEEEDHYVRCSELEMLLTVRSTNCKQ